MLQSRRHKWDDKLPKVTDGSDVIVSMDDLDEDDAEDGNTSTASSGTASSSESE